MQTVNRTFRIPQSHFFLSGPRGTGKTTLLRHSLGPHLSINLLEPDVFRNYSGHPERLTETVAAHPEYKIIVIDEIQKVPELLSVVHGLIEHKTGQQFILTGSSARKLRKGGVNLLGGRALHKSLCPFTAAELKSQFDLKKALNTGLIPIVYDSNTPPETLSAYVDLYIREEVMMEGLTRNVGHFTRFLETISFSHGSVLNLANVARECEVERKTVESYVAILEDLLLSHKLSIFTKRAKRQTIMHPKFYFFDTGLFRQLRPKGPLDSTSEIDGAALEGLVFQHLWAYREYHGRSIELYYWRTRSGNEVDFILYGEDHFAAIEVKNSTRIHPADLRSLKTFTSDYPESKGILVYRGKERLIRDKILILPCEEFLPEPGRFLT